MSAQILHNDSRHGHFHQAHSKSITLPTGQEIDLSNQTSRITHDPHHIDINNYHGHQNEVSSFYPHTPKTFHHSHNTDHYYNENAIKGKKRGKARKRMSAVNPTSVITGNPTGSATPANDNSSKTSNKSGRRKTTPISTAYAGPSFHASPAPSTLPIPKLLSKSVPEGISNLPISYSPEQESSESTSSSPIPTSPPLVHDNKSRESTPLDFLFQQAREAKAKEANRTSPQPQHTSREALHGSSPESINIPSHSLGSPIHSPSGGGIFAFEMDSAQPRPGTIGPSFATPYQQRLQAVRPNKESSKMSTSGFTDEESCKAKTEALKKQLFSFPGAVSHSPRPFEGSLQGHGLSPSPSPSRRRSPSTIIRNESSQSVPVSIAASRVETPTRALTPSISQDLHQYLASVVNGTPEPKLIPSSSRRRFNRPVLDFGGRSVSSPQAYPALSNSTISLNKTQTHLNGRVPTGMSTGLNHTSNARFSREIFAPQHSVQSMEADLRRVLKLGST
ncbi:MAG: hypothetical protein M1834_000415 [Cirrosporium novae-zelandiae]|nr:MAG: hypothetical protein M1834_000415 [Cirrosporium novae-zelandiae]